MMRPGHRLARSREGIRRIVAQGVTCAVRRIRPPLIRQQEWADCGPAALLSVLRYWKGNTSLPRLRALAGTDARGTHMAGLRSAAKAVGFDARGATGTLDELSREELPCIAHVVLTDDRSHFVVVHRVGRRKLSILDPATGRRGMERGEFLRIWRSRAVLLLRPTSSLLNERTAGRMAWIAGHGRTEPGWLVQSLFLGLSSAILGLATALFVQLLIDRFIPGNDVGMILLTGTLLLALLGARAVATWLRQRFLLQLNERIGLRLDSELLDRLFRLPIEFFERRALGDITTRRSDAMRILSSAFEILSTLVIDGLVLLGSVAALSVLAPQLSLVALGVLPLYATYLLKSFGSVRDAQTGVLTAHSAFEATFVDHLRGIGEILSSGASLAFVRRNVAESRALQRSVEQLGRIHAGITFASDLAGAGVIAAALVWGALHVVGGEMQLGQFVAGYSLLGGCLPAIQRLAQLPRAFYEGSISASRMRDLLLEPTAPAGGRLRFRLGDGARIEAGVLARPGGRTIIDSLDLHLAPGSIAGLFGPNGAGKSSLLAVLARMRELDGGRYLVDGVPTSAIALDEFRRSVAIVPEEVSLFAGTLADNVLLGRELGEPTRRLAWLEALGFESLMSRYPERWQTPLGERGRRLSAGERQVVGIMRALASEPELLLLDESLRSVDAEVEETLLGILLAYRRLHAVLLVSHERRILERLDRALYLVGGRIVDDGLPLDVFTRVPIVRGCQTPTGLQRSPPPARSSQALAHGTR